MSTPRRPAGRTTLLRLTAAGAAQAEAAIEAADARRSHLRARRPTPWCLARAGAVMTHLARTLLAVAVHLLPSQCRSRYDDEFDAELLSLSRRRRLGYALSILAAAPRLRWALLEVLCGGRASLRCWLGKHHDRRLHPNPDNHEVIALQCRRCGRVRDPKQYLPRKQRLDDVAWGGAFLAGGR